MLKKRVVIKVGTSTLTYNNNKLNLRRIEKLCRVVTELQSSGIDAILVTSGAISVGVGKMNLDKRPNSTIEKQALAAIGQCELMFIYSKFFGEYNQLIAQVLLTSDVINCKTSKHNVTNTFNTLLKMGIVPIVNENDTVSTNELEGTNFGDNDALSSIVACIIKADCLIILSDIDGLYDHNPYSFPQAKLIPIVEQIDDNIKSMAGNKTSNRGTGGMKTKIEAAEIATNKGIDCYIINGEHPESLYKIFNGENVGTLFKSH